MRFPVLQACYIGNKPKTQCLDVAHVTQLVIEKGMDDQSNAAVATSDIRRLYDSINLMLVARYLLKHGCPAGLVRSVLLCQLLPKLFFNMMSCCIELRPRAIGCMTGTRVAGVVGFVIVDSCGCVCQ